MALKTKDEVLAITLQNKGVDDEENEVMDLILKEAYKGHSSVFFRFNITHELQDKLLKNGYRVTCKRWKSYTIIFWEI